MKQADYEITERILKEKEGERRVERLSEVFCNMEKRIAELEQVLNRPVDIEKILWLDISAIPAEVVVNTTGKPFTFEPADEAILEEARSTFSSRCKPWI